MAEIRLNVNGRELTGFEGQTVLDIARENGIDIPTLCNDDRVKMYGSCGICVVEAEGNPKLLRSCSTYAADGMVISTDTPRVRASRRTALELLLSDHTGDCRPPCVLACPAQTDCQGYAGLLANGEYHEALKLVKDKIPLPSSIGRVCPHPCETACRRQMVEEPIAIASLKSFLGDKDLEQPEGLYLPDCKPDTGKSVAIVGGGPGGLTAAYFLRQMGHSVTVFDAMPQMGGMLRYGIPEYRLPKRVLARECDSIAAMGVKFENNVKLGKDTTLDSLRERFDAVITAVGAWTSMSLRCPGEELEGVLGGIDFLRDVAMGNPVFTGRRIAVVGGGNTAMDACRTAVRLGAEKVYNIYRRTKAEMPAEDIEITEAEEEGVIFKNLTNPIEVQGRDGKVSAIRLQIMELGEPDASGRRAPVPVEGKEETLEVDAVIVAIGQGLDPTGLEVLEKTRWRTIAADENTFLTSLDGVFAIGDATNKGADIAISAIGEAKKAVAMVDKYLNGEKLTYTEPFLVTSEVTADMLADREKAPRIKMPHRKPVERRDDFLEVNCGFSAEDAKKEASRCLECGCHDYFECKLIDYANQYAVKPAKYAGKVHTRTHSDDHPFIHRNPDKCILCGLCVRICDEVVGATALGLVDRGFDAVVMPALGLPLNKTDCISCGQCVTVCPTGALTEVQMADKQVPVRELATDTVCSFCSVGCRTKVTHTGDMLLRSLPVAEREIEALLCMKGRFGFGEIRKADRLAVPMLRRDGTLVPVSFDDAYIYLNKKLQAIQAQYGADSIAVTVGDRYTSEEALLIKEYANKVLGTKVYSLNKAHSGLADIIGMDCSTASLEELPFADFILAVGTKIMRPHTIAGLQVKKAVENGATLIALNSFHSAADDMATQVIDPGEDLSMLRGILKALLDLGKGKELPGYSKLAESLETVTPGAEAAGIAKAYSEAKRAFIFFEKNSVTVEAARLLGMIAAVAGNLSGARKGIIQMVPGANSQGLANLGIHSGDTLMTLLEQGTVRGLLVFGEDVTGINLEKLDFLAVQDLFLTGTAKAAQLVLPAQSYAEVSGSYVNATGKVQALRQVVPSFVERGNFDQLSQLAHCGGKPLPYRNVADLTALLERMETPEIKVSLTAAGNGSLLRDVPNTNALYNNLMAFAAEHQL